MMEENITLDILAVNIFGVLTRITMQFSKRGYNIDSLVAKSIAGTQYSQILVGLKGDSYVKDQLVKQISKLHDVKKVNII
ncbi:hypothetical protein EOM82_08395 [bacterium]|nr:hypothetical protein [bacterium]